jgi:hypothetical protein
MIILAIFSDYENEKILIPPTRISGKVKVFKRKGGLPGLWPQALKPSGNSLSCMQAATIARISFRYKQYLPVA